jgi:hypothetical protein
VPSSDLNNKYLQTLIFFNNPFIAVLRSVVKTSTTRFAFMSSPTNLYFQLGYIYKHSCIFDTGFGSGHKYVFFT